MSIVVQYFIAKDAYEKGLISDGAWARYCQEVLKKIMTSDISTLAKLYEIKELEL